MKIIIEMETDNSAFSEGSMDAEVRRILRKVADKLHAGQTDGTLMDINGNAVGKFEVIE